MAWRATLRGWLTPGHASAAPREHVAGLLVPGYLDAFVAERRAREIRGRTMLLAALIGLGALAFSAPDLWWLPARLGTALLPARLVVAAACLAVLALAWRRPVRPERAAGALAGLVLVAVLFYAYATAVFALVPSGATGLGAGLRSGYVFMPFLIVALPSLFPLTLLEVAAIGLPAMAIQAVIALVTDLLGPYSGWAQLWLLALLLGVAGLSAILQLSYLRASLRAAATDGLTGALTRSAGLAMLAKLVAAAQRHGTPLAVLYVDIDDFKAINDRFGHAAGDAVLRRVAGLLNGELRASDLLVRLGGEEFAIALPDTPATGTAGLLGRLRRQGLGQRPDGTAVTASVGVVEAQGDGCPDATGLLTLADERMYAAKRAGRNRIVGPGGAEPLLDAPAAEGAT